MLHRLFWEYQQLKAWYDTCEAFAGYLQSDSNPLSLEDELYRLQQQEKKTQQLNFRVMFTIAKVIFTITTIEL